MRNFKTFDKKAIIKESVVNFSKEIFKNEIVWTYLVGTLAKDYEKVYKLISGFNYDKNHSIFFEGQPQTPYIGIEGNSYIDMALGAVDIREGSISGLKYSNDLGRSVCFVEAKYLSDMSVRTEHFSIRNQMDRVIENLLCLKDKKDYPNAITFTLLTPKIFKEAYGSRIYSYKFNEYKEKLKKDKKYLADKIELSKENKRFKDTLKPNFIEKRLHCLNLNWVTFEEIFEIVIPELKGLDITKEDEAMVIWGKINSLKV